jgi:hypothetical protein
MRGKDISAADQEFARASPEYQIGPAGRNRQRALPGNPRRDSAAGMILTGFVNVLLAAP